ncbi:four-helix bundle copper-binding protein [Hymenobacter gummosus]|uniref:Four-helix bundle copper-binding protein n=1 Tax=Hymenobacter gummosus TaxID=1776032 RepID=A0A431TVA1_9BACT|nr:four-helix bundle copper-binding protein [Hymenobacter gummosus]RTQ45282.1 four-helix bundle copper-binding protein [Hymenobacter gummosus]
MHQQHQELLAALNACVAACEHCASACLQEEHVQMMARCISLDRDCSDVCALTARLVARGSEHAAHLLRECAEICQACADECGQHQHEHCQQCAEACRRCAEACRQGLAA